MPLSAKILFSQLYTGLPHIPVMPPLLTAFLLFSRLFLLLDSRHRFGYPLRPIGPAQPVIVSGGTYEIIPTQPPGLSTS